MARAEENGLAAPIASLLLAAMLGVTLISRLLAGMWADRMSPALVMLASSLFLPAGILLLAMADTMVSLWAGVLLFGLGFGGIFPAYAGIMHAIFPAWAAARWVSTLFFFGFLAAAFGSWLGGYLRDMEGNYTLAFHVAAGLSVLGLAAGAVHFRLHYRSERENFRQGTTDSRWCIR